MDAQRLDEARGVVRHGEGRDGAQVGRGGAQLGLGLGLGLGVGLGVGVGVGAGVSGYGLTARSTTAHSLRRYDGLRTDFGVETRRRWSSSRQL